MIRYGSVNWRSRPNSCHSPMFHATNSKMPASAASGTYSASGAATSTITSSVNACTMPAIGLFPPARMFVTVRAIVPVAGMPPKIGATMLATPCAINSWFESCFGPSVRLSAMRAHSSDSMAPSNAIVIVGMNNCLALVQLNGGSSSDGRLCGMPPKREPIVSTGNCSVAQSTRERDERDDRRRDACRGAQRARFEHRYGQRRFDAEQPWPSEKPDDTDRADRERVGIEGLDVRAEGIQLGEEVGRQLFDLQAEQVPHLRQRDQHRDAVGEADHDRQRDVAHQHAELEQAEHEHQRAGQHRRDQQVGQAVALDDPVDDDDERAGRAADLHVRSAERRNQEARDDRSEDPLLGLHA